MAKKIFAIAMVMTVLGGILAGCSKPAEEGAATDATKAPAAGEAK